MTALIVGTLLAVTALAYVMLPLVRGATIARGEAAPELPEESSAIDALREIEFDQATGKLSPEDYAALKATYTPLALAELRSREASSGIAADAPDPAEVLIARFKERRATCPEHGPRPESDAVFCSDCGRHLGGACAGCGEPVEAGAARFCVHCGASLAVDKTRGPDRARTRQA